MTGLTTSQLTLAYGQASIIKELNLTIPEHQITMIVGANGCGKSTLLRALARLLKPQGGHVLLDGADIRSLGTTELARRLGLLPQNPTAPDGLTVAELVRRGRYPHQGLFKRFGPEDAEAVESAMRVTAVDQLAGRNIDELSGGQRQRAWIALALAQQTDLLLLDEPTSFLDAAHQLEILDVITDLNADRGTTVVIVLHELNLAARYADNLIALKDGHVYDAGAPAHVITETMVADVFGMQSKVIKDPISDSPLVIPIGRHKAGISA